jgi:hypothetical protein
MTGREQMQPRKPLYDYFGGAGDMPPEVRIELARLMPCSVTYHEIGRDDEIERGAKNTIAQWDVCYRHARKGRAG